MLHLTEYARRSFRWGKWPDTTIIVNNVADCHFAYRVFTEFLIGD